MPKSTNLDENQVPPVIQNQSAMSAGQMLKQARLQAGVQLSALSEILKVPVRQLEALEADQYLIQQSPVFARGLASGVCRQLHIDPAPVLALLPKAISYSETLSPRRHMDVAPAELGLMPSSSDRSRRKALWAAVAMTLLIVGLIWLPGPSQWGLFDQGTIPPKSSEPAPALPAVPAPNPSPEPQASAPSVSDAATLGGISNVPFEPVPPTITTSSAPSTGSGSAVIHSIDLAKLGPLAAKTLASDLLFSTSSDSWLELRDGGNQVLWSGTLKPGSATRLQVPLPFSAVLGRADAVQVLVKGQAFDLKPYTKLNVARFEVKP